MGKTFRNEKSFKPKRRPLNNHRDLPDYTPLEVDVDNDFDIDQEEIEAYYGKELQSQDRINQPEKDSKTP